MQHPIEESKEEAKKSSIYNQSKLLSKRVSSSSPSAAPVTVEMLQDHLKKLFYNIQDPGLYELQEIVPSKSVPSLIGFVERNIARLCRVSDNNFISLVRKGKPEECELSAFPFMYQFLDEATQRQHRETLDKPLQILYVSEGEEDLYLVGLRPVLDMEEVWGGKNG